VWTANAVLKQVLGLGGGRNTGVELLDLELGETGPRSRGSIEDIEDVTDLSEAEPDVLTQPDERDAFGSRLRISSPAPAALGWGHETDLLVIANGGRSCPCSAGKLADLDELSSVLHQRPLDLNVPSRTRVARIAHPRQGSDGGGAVSFTRDRLMSRRSGG
jgi:hypothetical protein